MPKRYIITLMAANRVGIMAAVTTALAELGGDLLEVSQTVLQKFFTIILAAEFPEHRPPEVIVDHIRGVCSPYGIEVSLKDPDAEPTQPDDAWVGTERYVLTVSGADKPGVIREISARLAQEGIDITDLYAVRSRGDGSFVMVMELAVPSGVDAVAVRRDVEALGVSGGLSAALQHENIFTATNDPRPVRVAAQALAARRSAADE
ncbi:MAG: ACT domain-containing protein [Planctomycetaceae bacterium]